MLAKICMFVKACDICQKTKIKFLQHRPYPLRIPVDYSWIESLLVDIKFMPKGFDGLNYFLVANWKITNFILAILIEYKTAQVIGETLIHRVICMFGPLKIIVDKDSAFTGKVIYFILCAMNCQLKLISSFYHGSLGTKRQIQAIGKMMTKTPDRRQRNYTLVHCCYSLWNEHFCICSIIRFFTIWIGLCTITTGSIRSDISTIRTIYLFP